MKMFGFVSSTDLEEMGETAFQAHKTQIFVGGFVICRVKLI